ncbi:hypothetical protein SH661x_002320 [Planctomicrobium sp. SH661]|uniref:hypothetical protein n=1 Tax=Planctomicrobium sp. SH661 TaxID=3448124 RepID=UPI003F5B11B1
MIYTLENTTRIGQPVIVKDATGTVVPKCLECDTESGFVKRFALQPDGRPFIFHRKPVFISEHRPAPLSVTRKEQP